MNSKKRFCFRLLAAVPFLLALNTALAQTAPPLGTSQNFAALGASAVSNAGAAGTVITGNLRIWPNGAGSITGFPPGVVNGTIHAADGPA